MKPAKFSEEAEEVLGTIIAVTPSIVRSTWKERISTHAKSKAALEGRKAISRDDILKSAKEVMPSGFGPLFLKMMAPEKFNELSKSGVEGYRAAAKRWVKINVKESPAGKKVITRRSEKPYILSICGSPRKGGNTDLLVKKINEGAELAGARCETIYLHNKKIGYCIGCRKCREEGSRVEDFCVIKDDMTEIYKKLCEADGIVIGYPIYTARESAQTATFWDRLDCWSNAYNRERFGERKPGILVMSWAWFEPDTYMDQMEGMLMLMSLRNIEPVAAVTASGCRGTAHGRGVVVQDEKGMNKVFNAGKKLAQIIKS